MSFDRRTIVISLFALGLTAIAPLGMAASPGPDGFVRTGIGVQTASHWPFTFDVFTIAHEIKTVPDAKTRRAMIDADVDKRFSLTMLRDIDAPKLRGGLREGFRRNGAEDGERIERFLAGIPESLPKGKRFTIVYDAGAKETKLVADGAVTATVDGAPFMKATWSIWFGKSKPATLGDDLLKDL